MARFNQGPTPKIADFAWPFAKIFAPPQSPAGGFRGEAAPIRGIILGGRMEAGAAVSAGFDSPALPFYSDEERGGE
jgi:hypothetical protein